MTTSLIVFDTVAELLAPLVGDLDLLDLEITPASTFHEDLGLQSIDLVTFAGILAEHFGPDVNLAEHLAQKDLDEVIELTVGAIAEFVSDRLAARG
ncbi:phosphopantetheine-binding protein [Kribbella sp. NBC_01505]|uniref:phosphopantetheine-binding protein n=1 Tax=Kribbella sp. NBC_01505 TaxID=2903580 RepID=UPI00386922AE